MSEISYAREYREVELHLIDPPELAMRESFDEQKLMELADDIKMNGLIAPLVLIHRSPRYEIVAGHRRFAALTMIEAVTAPALVYADSRVDVERIKVSENAEREDVNPAHEARYFTRLLELRCGNDTDRLAALVGRSREYVETRVLLLKGDSDVLTAVDREQISLSVARELNAIKDVAHRRVYLEAAIRGGVSGRQAREWRIQANGFLDRQVASAPAGDAAAAMPAQPIDSIYRCLCCGSDEDAHDMMLVYVHKACWRIVLRPILEGTRPASS